jgi:uncharacterized membrane protein YhaH (DUF805 family)
MMTFPESIRVCLSKYADFSGRARRSEFWYFVLWTILVSFVARVLDVVLGTRWGAGSGLVETVAALALILPSLAVGARRLHDIRRSASWLLLLLIPFVGALILLVLCLFDSTGDNQFGPSPKSGAQPAY